MQFDKLGDSYDIVKQSLLRWLGTFGEWKVHPMFTDEEIPDDKVKEFERLLGTKVISRERLKSDSDRLAYFSCATGCDCLFLDPDKGLNMKPTGRSPKHLYSNELTRLVQQRNERSLTMVFDQSVSYGSEEDRKSCIEQKLKLLNSQGISTFAYWSSHACFIVAGRDYLQVDRAHALALAESRLPEYRFLSTKAKGCW